MVAVTNKFLLPLSLLLLCAHVAAAADAPLIATAVLQFTGPDAKMAEAVVYRALKSRSQFIPFHKWTDSAKRNFATSMSPDDVAVIAREIGAKIVINGSIKRVGRKFVLRVSTRAGESGQLVDQLKYDMRASRITAVTTSELAKEINESVDKAVETGTAAPPPDKTPVPVAPTITAEEKPMTPAAPKVSAPPEPKGRPAWAPYLDVELGFLIQGRNFVFNDNTGLFSGGAGAGVRLDATVFPFASTYKKAGGVLAGLGFGLLLDAPFWPASVDKDAQNNPVSYPTKELRVEGGLRWWFTLSKVAPLPQLLVGVGGGRHSFEIERGGSTTYAGPPDIVYTYVSITAGVRLRPAKLFRVALTNDVLFSTGTGPLSTVANYGATSLVLGFRPQLKLEFFVWHGLKVGAAAYYERTIIKLATEGMGDRRDAGVPSTAVDQFFGGTFFVGYQF